MSKVTSTRLPNAREDESMRLVFRDQLCNQAGMLGALDEPRSECSPRLARPPQGLLHRHELTR